MYKELSHLQNEQWSSLNIGSSLNCYFYDLNMHVLFIVAISKISVDSY